MVTIPAFSSVPGAAVPGNAEPGLIQQAAGSGTYPYYGHATLYYLDYLDTTATNAEHTLVAVPGGSYSMLAVNGRAGLTVPPPDGRWAPGGGEFMARWEEPAHVQLARARRVNADLQARLARGEGIPG